MSEKVKAQESANIENAGRRKAVKTIVGGVTAIAAYNILPSKWGTPIIEQVFLPAHAATSGGTSQFVGSWAVNTGAPFGLNPPTYTGQEAAAVIFGGNASDYLISTVSDQVADINSQAHIDVHGGGSAIVAHDFKVDTGAVGYNTSGDTSAYVINHANSNVNYAFKII